MTLFRSALLLFAVQPMFTKMVLPRIGGAAAVWSVAMVFFQVALLLGYAYAHLLARTLSPARAALVHLGLLAVAAPTLPIGIAQGFGGPQECSSSGCWRCLPHPSVCRSSRSPRTHPCCKTGSQRAVIRTRQPLRSLCGVQSRVVRRPADLSVRRRAAVYAAHPDLAWSVGYLVSRLLIAVAAVIVARAGAPSIRTSTPPRRGPHVRRAPSVDRLGRDSGRAS